MRLILTYIIILPHRATYLLTGTFPFELAISLIKAWIFSRDWIGDMQNARELWRTAISCVAQNCKKTMPERMSQ